MIAALGNFDIGRVLWGGQDARSVVVVKIVRQVRNRTVPLPTRESPLCRPRVALGPRIQYHERRIVMRDCWSRSNASCGQDVLQLSGADYGIHFRNALANFVAEALSQAASYHQLFCSSGSLVGGHFEDCVD